MKKLLLITPLIAVTTIANAANEGYFFFTGPSRTLWENFTPPGNIITAPSGVEKVAFLFGTGTPLVGTTGTPTNSPAFINGWFNILNDPNFSLATDANTGLQAIGNSGANGTFAYNSANYFPVTGTSPNTTYTVFVIGWDSFFPTPQAAASGGSAVGWSKPFSYTPSDVIGLPLTMSASGLTPFGIIIPEPSTLSLASLGAMALTFYRRRK